MEQVKWGFEAASIEQQICEHRRTHNAIGDYRWHLDKVKTDLVIAVLPYTWARHIALAHWCSTVEKRMLESSSSLQKALVS